MKNYDCVPVDVITGKDLDYLSDMFQWNYLAFKKVCNDIEYINTQDILDFFGKASDLFENNLNIILDIIANPGGDVNE
jgi:hypothetical protein